MGCVEFGNDDIRSGFVNSQRVVGVILAFIAGGKLSKVLAVVIHLGEERWLAYTNGKIKNLPLVVEDL